MAAPNGRNFQVSGLGVKGHVWVEAAINRMTKQHIVLLGVFRNLVIVSSLEKISADVLGTCMEINERGFFSIRDDACALCFCSLLISFFLFFLLLSSAFCPLFYLFSCSLLSSVFLFLFASLLSNNDSRDRSALWLAQCHI